jgi:hypothetical protein
MINTEAIKKSLAEGVDPSFICMTCPWDRLCLTPPGMTSGDIDEQINKMTKKTEEEGKDTFLTQLMATIIFAGKDTSATLCPVFVNRLHSSDGRKVADAIRDMMQKWE